MLPTGAWLAAVTALATSVSCSTLNRRDDTFHLYAYGSGGIGGLDVFYMAGYAYVGNWTNAKATDPSATLITWTGTDVLTVKPDSKMPANVAFTQATFYVPDESSSSSKTTRAGFLVGDAKTDPQGGPVITSGWTSYGDSLLLLGTPQSQLKSDFVAKPTGIDDVWELQWKPLVTVEPTEAQEAGAPAPGPVPVSLKRNRPAYTAEVPREGSVKGQPRAN